MKRSSIFLGVSSALLAVVGVAAAKAHRSIFVTGYYKNTSDVCKTLPTFKYSFVATAGTQPQYLYGTTFTPIYTNPSCDVKAAADEG